jgi:hypothetical protein
VTVHGIAHLAVYPVSGSVDPDVDASKFWVPMSLARDAAGWAARVLLVLAAVGFLLTGHRLATGHRVSGPRPAAWTVPAAVGSVSSIAAVALLWSRLHPRPEALWIGAAISSAVLLTVVTELVARRSRERVLTA